MLSHDVPYETQINELACGAACLSMVFRLFGIPVSSEKIWSDVEKHEGVPFAQHICSFANKQSVTAMALYLQDCSGEILDFCLLNHLEVILLQRFVENPFNGHYTVLIGADKDFIYYHDPNPNAQDGQGKKISRYDLLWNMTALENSQMGSGRQMIIVANQKHNATVDCMKCFASIPVIPSLVDYLKYKNSSPYGVLCADCGYATLTAPRHDAHSIFS